MPFDSLKESTLKSQLYLKSHCLCLNQITTEACEDTLIERRVSYIICWVFILSLIIWPGTMVKYYLFCC